MKYAFGVLLFLAGWQGMLTGQILDQHTDLGSLFSQKGEVCFSFSVSTPREVLLLSPVVSIAHLEGN